jgi:NADH:ubiquinone oxidoreductase subunit H
MKMLEHLFYTFKDISSQKLSFYFLSLLSYTDEAIISIKNAIVKCLDSLITTFGVEAVVMSAKFLLSISLLIFIRGGLPRYRFDHLTRIGWVKFLTLVVCFLLIELLFLYTVMG